MPAIVRGSKFTEPALMKQANARDGNFGDRAPIGLLYTGGTFGMLPSDRGYVPDADLPARVDQAMATMVDQDLPAVEWLDVAGPPVNSSDIRPEFWYRVAETIRTHAERLAGLVIIHGTDTLAFTGSALSFLLPDLDRPVVVTGASKPLGEPGSDAGDNLLAALRLITHGGPAEVSLVFGGHALRANRASKRFPDDIRLFDSPHLAPLARMGKTVELADPPPALPAMNLSAARYRDVSLALLPVYPGIGADLLLAMQERGVEGVLLEAYPAGIGPGGDDAFVDAIGRLTTAGVVVAAVSQSRLGRIQLGRYATSTPLAEAGLIGGADMTREAALTKLHYLLASGMDNATVRTLFQQNLRGEMTPE